MCHVSMHGCHGASNFVKDSASFVDFTAEAALEEVTNLSLQSKPEGPK